MDNTKKADEVVLFRMTGTGLAWYVLPFPSCGFVVCVILALLNDFEGSTGTHCRVSNYLPSISAAIGGSTPQRYIWRICIALHSAPRLVIAVCYYNHYLSYHVTNYAWLFGWLAFVNSALHFCENLCLVGLTYVSSSENHTIHVANFIGFMVFSQLYMLLSLVLLKWSRSYCGMTVMDKKSYKWKRNLAAFNISIFLMAIYVYWRHNAYCEPGMYSIYAVFQYFIVSSNILYHTSFIHDLGKGALIFRMPSESVHEKTL